MGGCTHAHARFPDILCFDGAINRRKAAVKRIESQVRPFCRPRARTPLSPLFSIFLALALRLFFIPSRSLFLVPFLADVVKKPGPIRKTVTVTRLCSFARPARSGPSAHHYVTNVTAVRRSVDCHVLRGLVFGVVCAAS